MRGRADRGSGEAGDSQRPATAYWTRARTALSRVERPARAAGRRAGDPAHRREVPARASRGWHCGWNTTHRDRDGGAEPGDFATGSVALERVDAHRPHRNRHGLFAGSARDASLWRTDAGGSGRLVVYACDGDGGGLHLALRAFSATRRGSAGGRAVDRCRRLARGAATSCTHTTPSPRSIDRGTDRGGL